MKLIQFGSLTLLGHYIMGILELWVHGMIDDPHMENAVRVCPIIPRYGSTMLSRF